MSIAYDETQLQIAPISPGVPHSREAEEACLGSVFINPETYFDLSGFLKTDDFYIHRNRWIWEAIKTLHEKHVPIDLVTVSEHLEQSGQLSEIGGSAYLTSLLNQVPSSVNAVHYGRIVEEHSIRRKMLNAANQIATLAYKGGDVRQNYSVGKKAYDDSLPVTGQFQHIGDVASDQWDLVQARSNGEEDGIIKTGFVDLDKLLDGGLRPANLMYLGGRPGMGKTAFLLDILENAGKQGKNVALFSLEMSNEEVTQRIIVKQGIPMKSMRRGTLSPEQWTVFSKTIENLQKYNIFMNDIPMVRPTQLRAQAHSLHNQHGIDLLVVDYIQLMESDSSKSTGDENRNNEVSAISRSMKVLARELKIPVLCAAQLSRDLEKRQDKRPQLSDLRDSGSLEQDADIVAFLYRDAQYNKDAEVGAAEVNVAKHRNGETGKIDLVFRGELMKFESAMMVSFK